MNSVIKRDFTCWNNFKTSFRWLLILVIFVEFKTHIHIQKCTHGRLCCFGLTSELLNFLSIFYWILSRINPVPKRLRLYIWLLWQTQTAKLRQKGSRSSFSVTSVNVSEQGRSVSALAFLFFQIRAICCESAVY